MVRLLNETAPPPPPPPPPPQARCRGWLGRQKSKQLEVQHSAAMVIQQNVDAYMEVREWSWWELFITIKPKLAVWRAEEDIKERDVSTHPLCVCVCVCVCVFGGGGGYVCVCLGVTSRPS